MWSAGVTIKCFSIPKSNQQLFIHIFQHTFPSKIPVKKFLFNISCAVPKLKVKLVHVYIKFINRTVKLVVTSKYMNPVMSGCGE